MIRGLLQKVSLTDGWAPAAFAQLERLEDEEVKVEFPRPFDILQNFKALQRDKYKGRPIKKPERLVLSGWRDDSRLHA